MIVQKIEETPAATTAQVRVPKGWPEGVWFNSKHVPGDRKQNDFDMAEMLRCMIMKNENLKEKALANLTPELKEQIELRLEHSETIDRITAELKKRKRNKKAQDETKPAKLPARLMTANQQLLADLMNALRSAEENRALIADHAEEALEANIKSVARFEDYLEVAVADRQAGKPLHEAFENLFNSLVSLPPGPFESTETEAAARIEWAKENAKAMNRISRLLWGRRVDLRKANKKAEHNAEIRKKALKKRLRLENNEAEDTPGKKAKPDGAAEEQEQSSGQEEEEE
uniref:Uncharacterized protein n=1 Tax=viral metagenome TaxID=1070528 RepID=A0A6C0BP44_9ZZZZ